MSFWGKTCYFRFFRSENVILGNFWQLSTISGHFKDIFPKQPCTDFKKNPYLSVHWRYDRKDFGAHCRKGKSGEYRKACKTLKHGGFNGTSLAENLVSFINSNKPDVKNIYFAATPQDAKLVREIKGNVTKIDDKFSFYGHDELDDYIKKEYAECDEDKMRMQLHDFFSQVEMEICRESTVFMPSDSSSWSVGVMYERDVLRRSEEDKPNRVLFD